MSDAETTWALVVGIDEYDEPTVPRLKGAAADAVAVVEWLRELGVPDAQILLHARPSTDSRTRLDSLGLPWVDDAREPAIWNSVAQLLAVPDGSRLFVFLSGHGLWEPSTGRCFLTQEAGVNKVYPNLGLDLYINCFLSGPFARQFLVMDGCLNLPYTPEERQRIAARIYSGVPYTPRANNWLVACYAASQGEKAFEIDGRGAFLSQLLPAMNPGSPVPDGTRMDFKTGTRSVDMQMVMNPGVIEQVKAAAAAQVPSKVQTPKVQVLGNLSAGDPSPVFDVPSSESVKLQVTIDPLAAAADVEAVKLTVATRPWWSMTTPVVAGGQIDWPISVALPANLPTTAVCQVRSNAPWAEELVKLEFSGTIDQAQVFRLAPRLAAGGSAGSPGPDGGRRVEAAFPTADEGVDFDLALPPVEPRTFEQFSVKVVGQNGEPAGILYGEYETVAASLGVTLPEVTTFPREGDGSAWLPIGRGIQLQRHETGPEFRVPMNSQLRGRKVVADWADALSRLIPNQYAIMTVVRGDSAPDYEPNLRLLLPKGGAEAMAGRLASHSTVLIGPPSVPKEPIWRSRAGQSLSSLEAKPLIRVEPGPIQVRIDLPWGSWSDVVAAPSVGHARTVRLPRKIGTPPLRVSLHGQPAPTADYVVYGTSGAARGARIGSETEPGVQLAATEPGRARWALAAPDTVNLDRGAAVVRLGTRRTALFPILSGRPLAVDWSRRGLRVEPLSEVESPEWDLLVGTGRLDAITVNDAVILTEDKWFDALLGLAGAYAVYATSGWMYLGTVTMNLRRLEPSGVDVDLLAIAGRRGVSGTIATDDRQLLVELADKRHIPVMRWGVTLARDLLVDADLRRSPWFAELGRIEERLSALSVWTAWTEPAANA